jgi:hypothetical protein
MERGINRQEHLGNLVVLPNSGNPIKKKTVCGQDENT